MEAKLSVCGLPRTDEEMEVAYGFSPSPSSSQVVPYRKCPAREAKL